MELLEEIKSSLEKQSREQGKTLRPSSEGDYITWSLDWQMSIEGYLFWNILHNSYYHQGIYDYVSLVKLYHVFGRDAFYHRFSTLPYYIDYFDRATYTLTGEGFEKLCKEIEIYGINRVC